MDSPYEVKARIVRILAHPKRLEIVDVLRGGERTVKEIAEATRLAQTSASHHLAALRQGGIVEVRREGSFVHYRLADAAIGDACLRMDDAVLAVVSRQQRVGLILTAVRATH